MSVSSSNSDLELQSYSERTLALIKPEALEDAEAIEDHIRKNGFAILAKRQVHLTPEQAAELYKGHYGRHHFPHLVAHISRGPVMALVLAARNAIQKWSTLMGPAREPQGAVCYYGMSTSSHVVAQISRDPVMALTWHFLVEEAQAYWPDSLRACYGRRTAFGEYFNGLHGSENHAEAVREIHFFFPTMVVGPILRRWQVKDYIQEHLTSVLTPALTALAHERPAEPVLWLAEYLRGNNPNEPRVTSQPRDMREHERCHTPQESVQSKD